MTEAPAGAIHARRNPIPAQSNPGRRRRDETLLPALLTAAGAVYLGMVLASATPGDYPILRATARALVYGGTAYVEVLTPSGGRLDMNPPHFHLLFAPFALLPESAGLWCWRTANALGLLAGLAIVWPLAPSVSRHWVAAAIVTSPATIMTLVAGQVVGILVPLAALAGRATASSMWVVAGVSIGLLVSCKPFLWPCALWVIWRGGVRGLVAVGGVVLVTISAGVFVWGVPAYRGWIEALAAVAWEGSVLNASWTGFVRRWGAGPSGAVVTGLGLATLGVVTTWWLRRDDRRHQLLHLLVLSIVLSPLGWVYYLWLAAPLLLLYRSDRRPLHPLVACLWLPPPLLLIGQPGALATLTAGSAYTYGLLGLWWSTRPRRSFSSNQLRGGL